MSITQTYYIFNALFGLGMGATTTMYAPFLQSIGLTLGEVSLVNAIFWGVLIAAELPTGMLADGRSRAFSLKVGMLMLALGSVLYVFASGFWSAAFAEGMCAIGMAFLSGAQQAWIADALTRQGKLDQLRVVYFNDMLIRTVVFIAGGFIGSLIALYSYRLIWVPLIILSLAAWFVSYRFMNGQGEPIDPVSEREALVQSWRHLRASRSLKWVIASMILFGSVVSFNHFWSPFFKPKVGTLGLSWVWIIVYAGCIPSGLIIRRFGTGLCSEANLIVLSLILSGVGLLVLGMTQGLLLPLAGVVMHEFGRGMFQPLTDTFVQHRVKSSYRATFGSLQSFLGRAGFMIVPLIVWIFLEGKPDSIQTIQTVWIACGLVLLIGSGLAWILRPQT